MKTAILSNINVSMLIRKLSEGLDVYEPEGYDTWVQDLVRPDSNLYAFAPGSIFVLLDGRELFKNTVRNELESVAGRYLSYIEASVKQNPGVTYFISDIDVPSRELTPVKVYRACREAEFIWYRDLYELSVRYKNLYIFELKKIIEETGRDTFYSDKMWYLSSCKFSAKAEKQIIKSIGQLLRAADGKRKKCLALDLDNTLWGGVAGEEGPDGIALSENKEGARYKDLQKRIAEIRETGVILAIVSKNNEDEALEVIRNHRDMVLREGDFTARKINWNEKYQSIGELADELNIGEDSFVFVDDSPVEREKVAKYNSQVTVPDFPQDTCQLEKFISDVYYDNFLILDVTNEDKNKTQMYEQNFRRSQEQRHFTSIDDYLKSLETEIRIAKIREEDLVRTVQLLQKTNQFNLTTKRYTEADIRDMQNSGRYLIYTADVRDRFGDNGKCAVVIVENKGNGIADIDSFIMSCRIMGRFIEDDIVTYIENEAGKLGFKEMHAHYRPTNKNMPVKELYERLGYESTGGSESKDYRLLLAAGVPEGRKRLAKVLENT